MQNRKIGNDKAVGTYSGVILEHHLPSAALWELLLKGVLSCSVCCSAERLGFTLH